jgi:hypothetical protein
MRSRLVALLTGCLLVAVTTGASYACSFNTQASTDSQAQQTAQAQMPSSGGQAQ